MEVTMNQILMTIMAAGVVLGGTDRLLGNKFGYGDKYMQVIIGKPNLRGTSRHVEIISCLSPDVPMRH